MRLSGLTRSGERMAEFMANNQRPLFASIVLAFGLRGRFLSFILRTNGGAAMCFGHPARSMKAVQSILGRVKSIWGQVKWSDRMVHERIDLSPMGLPVPMGRNLDVLDGQYLTCPQRMPKI